MATLPTVPGTFAFQADPSIALLNQLAYCVSFLNTNPCYASYTMSATPPTLTTNIETVVTGWTAAVDRDSGLGSPGKYTAATPGYFSMAAHLDFAANSTGIRHAYFQVTTGASNPGGAGLVSQFGGNEGNADQTTDTHIQIAQQSPYLYVGDFVQVMAFQTSGGNLALGPACQWFVTLDSLGP